MCELHSYCCALRYLDLFQLAILLGHVVELLLQPLAHLLPLLLLFECRFLQIKSDPLVRPTSTVTRHEAVHQKYQFMGSIEHPHVSKACLSATALACFKT